MQVDKALALLLNECDRLDADYARKSNGRPLMGGDWDNADRNIAVRKAVRELLLRSFDSVDAIPSGIWERVDQLTRLHVKYDMERRARRASW